jgi:hypothetical protein
MRDLPPPVAGPVGLCLRAHSRRDLGVDQILPNPCRRSRCRRRQWKFESRRPVRHSLRCREPSSCPRPASSRRRAATGTRRTGSGTCHSWWLRCRNGSYPVTTHGAVGIGCLYELADAWFLWHPRRYGGRRIVLPLPGRHPDPLQRHARTTPYRHVGPPEEPVVNFHAYRPLPTQAVSLTSECRSFHIRPTTAPMCKQTPNPMQYDNSTVMTPIGP